MTRPDADKSESKTDAYDMEWQVGKSKTGRSFCIETKNVGYWQFQEKANGQLRKDAKECHCEILGFVFPNRRKRILQQICYEHNLWINRDNPEKQMKYLAREIRKAIKESTQILFRSVCGLDYDEVMAKDLLRRIFGEPNKD